jgi:hypothetical protein
VAFSFRRQPKDHRPEEYLTTEGGISNLPNVFDESLGDETKLKVAILSSQMIGWLLFEPFHRHASDFESVSVSAIRQS